MKTTFNVCTAVLLAAVAPVIAAPVTGQIGFSGTVQLNTTDASTASTVVVWTGPFSRSANSTGSFTNIANNAPVSFSSSSWPFTSGPLTNYWSVGGFIFNLTSSSVSFDSGGFVLVSLNGTVSGNGYQTTACVGSFTTGNPSADGAYQFTALMSFQAVPAPPNLLIFTNGPNSLSIHWPTNALSSYTLQQNTNLAATNWITSSYPITNGFGTNFCIVSPLTNNLFFRLSQ